MLLIMMLANINNGVSLRSENFNNQSNGLLEQNYGERLDTRATVSRQAELIKTWKPWQQPTEPKAE
jgi:hypothetical protein